MRSFPVPSAFARRLSNRSAPLVGATGLLITVLTALTAPAGAATRSSVASPAPATSRAASTAADLALPVRSLAMTGTSTKVTVHRIYRKGQEQWVNHVLDTRLVDLDGCQARRSNLGWDRVTYRSTVRAVCAQGPAQAERAARQLVARRPWYHVEVTRVPLVGFGLLADLPEGNDRAFPAALAQLPTGPFTFADGDDLSVNYVGRGVSQAQLDAAVAAFARALGIRESQVEVTPLAAR